MEHFEDLKKTKIFSSSNELDCQAMMFCFKTRFKTFEKNERIVSQGDDMEEVVLIVKGAGIVENIDSMGNISIVERLRRGEIYGVESAYAGDITYKDSLIATEKTMVLFMNKHRLINPCENKCRRHDAVVKHLMQMVAESNIKLLEKLTHISKKTIRDKLLSYFSSIVAKKGSNYFEIPFNKTELANYLSVDRSAMSTELSKMREEGIIDFDKKQYHLINKK
ncbi:MAG: Crp/Fnr family transcriptional regulator [Clostridiales bacterium]|nr:Crp/Fnr family transcriptional regulator [Clostridiales bacterium]